MVKFDKPNNRNFREVREKIFRERKDCKRICRSTTNPPAFSGLIASAVFIESRGEGRLEKSRKRERERMREKHSGCI